MNHSIFWARLIGLYSVILSVWCFINIKNIALLLAALVNSASSLMILGLGTLSPNSLHAGVSIALFIILQ